MKTRNQSKRGSSTLESGANDALMNWAIECAKSENFTRNNTASNPTASLCVLSATSGYSKELNEVHGISGAPSYPT